MSLINTSANFAITELTRTDTGLRNVPNNDQTAKLVYLTHYVLQLIRDRWGRQKITSAFRSEAVNNHPDVRGASDSQHRLGEAADFVPLDANIDEVFKWVVKESGIPYGQAILEENSEGSRWIHISLVRAYQVNGIAMTARPGDDGKMRYELYT